MARIDGLFVTKLYRARLAGARAREGELMAACRAVARHDEAGRAWCRAHGYHGYTSYASLDDLPWRMPPFQALAEAVQPHVEAFMEAIELDRQGRRPALDSMWINILEPGGVHSGHVHPRSLVSGTYYVQVPAGSAALRLEDPRLPLMMAAPPKRARASLSGRSFVYLAPRAGDLVLFESFVRHEVPRHEGEGARISVSFNYGLR